MTTPGAGDSQFQTWLQLLNKQIRFVIILECSVNEIVPDKVLSIKLWIICNQFFDMHNK